MYRDPKKKLTGNFRQDVAAGRFVVTDSDEDFIDLFAKASSWGMTNADGHRMDAGETAYITRQLLYIKARTFDIKYPEFMARTFIPVSHEVPTGADDWSYCSWDMIGMAKIITNYATDFPRVDALKTETKMPVKPLGAAYDYSIQDMRRVAFTAAQGGGQLDIKKATMARRAIESSIDDIAALGSPDAGFAGFINNPNVPVLALPTGNWGIATSLQIIADINAMVQRVNTQSLNTEHPNMLVVPDFEFGLITQMPYSTFGNHTVATWVAQNNPYIGKNNGGIDQWVKLRKQNATKTGGRCVVYRRDPDALTLEIPQEFEQFAPQMEGMTYVIHCHARIGGVAWYYPLSACYGDGSS